MKLYNDGQLVVESSTTELKELESVDIKKIAEVAVIGESFSKFDKVEIVSESYYGRANKIGETAEIKETYYLNEIVYSVYENDGYVGVYPQSALKLIEEEPEEVLSYENVKIGELFEVVNNAAQKKFPVGNVVRLMDSLLNDEHSSKFEDVVSGEVGFSTYKEIKRHTPEVLSEDNVKEGEYFVITDSNNYSNAHAFDIGEIVKAKSYADSTTFKAEHMDESDWWYVYYTNVRRATATEIAEATKPKEVKFKVGDVVSAGTRDRFATVVEGKDADGFYQLYYIKDGDTGYREPSEMRHATEEEKSHLQTLIGREKDEYKVGDLARLETSGLRNSMHTHVGCIFEVGHNTLAYTNPKHLKLITPVEWRHDFVEEVK